MTSCYYWKIGLELVSLVSSGATCFHFYEASCGIRQGGVLSPYLLAVCIDSFTENVRAKYYYYEGDFPF